MFSSALTAGQLTAIRTNGYNARQYVLFAPNTVVFQARVNQASFTPSFALVDFDNVAVGSHTAIKEGFTVYIGATTDIRSASFVGYARRDNAGVVATATSININQTSADIQDNWWITVVKDVRLWYKLPRRVDDAHYFKDYSITYRKVRPLVTGLQSCYVQVLSGGVADFALAPSASGVDADATSSFTWAWDADGGAFQAGSASTKDVTLRYTTAGHYMPRVTVTDSNGVTNWFTCHLFVVPANYSSVVETGAEGARIDRDLETGNTITLAFFEGVDTVPDYTFCALWSPNSLSTQYASDIQFVGRLRNEQMDSVLDPLATYLPRTTFQVEGVGAELGRLFNAASLTIRNKTSPTAWDEVKKLTPLRALGYYVSEHTTLSNLASLMLDDLTNAFVTQAITLDKTSVLEQCQRLLDSTNRTFEYAPSGGVRTARKAWFLSDSERNGLMTIASFVLRDMQVDGTGGVIYSVSEDMVNTVGRFRAYGGSYNEAINKVQVYEAIAPAVSPTEGDDNGSLNGQILTANALGYDELGSRCANAFAEAQPPTLLTVQLLDAYEGLIPSASQWYTFTISADTNNRGVTYSTAERWTLQSVSIEYDNALGRRAVTGIFRLETIGKGFQVVVTIPPEATDSPVPIMPVSSPYPNLPTDPIIRYPDPDDIPIDNAPPFTPEDIDNATRPIQPGTTAEQIGQTGVAGMAWAGDSVYAVSNLPAIPSFANVTPINLDGMTVQDGKLSRFDNKGYVLANDGNGASRFFRTNAFGAVDYARTELVGEYEIIRSASSAGEIYAVSNNATWTHIFDFSVDDGGWGKLTIDPSLIGSYASGRWNGINFSFSGSDFRRTCRIERNFTTTTLTSITVNLDYLDGTFGLPAPPRFRVYADGFGSGNPSLISTNTMSPTNVVSWSGNITTDTITLDVTSSRNSTATYSGQVRILSITITGLGINPFGSGNNKSTILSVDHGATFAIPVIVGDATPDIGGIDADIIGTRIYAAVDGKVRQANSGGAYSDATGGDTSGTYPMCIVAFGTTTDKYIMATPASVSGESMWKVIGGTPTAITPNDGVSDGLAVSPNCIAMADGIETHIVAVLSFGGVRKLAYSIDGGSTWGFNTQITNSAGYVRMIRVGTLYYIAVCDGDVLWWGTWNGTGAIMLFEKTAPQAIAGFEFR